jgi:SAM-dependent methyltransferase
MNISTSPTRPIQKSGGHYNGDAGKEYFARQRLGGELSAHWNAPVWRSHIGPSDSVLDFGCGGGYLLASFPCLRKVGVEINPAAREEAERQGIETYAALQDLPKETFSRVISNHALEHTPCPLEILIQLRSLLAENGELLLMLPLDDWRARHHRRYAPGDMHRHLYAWTPQHIGNLMEDAGFLVKEIAIVTDAMPPNMKLCEILMKIPLLKKIAGRISGMFLKRRQIFARAVAHDVRQG